MRNIQKIYKLPLLLLAVFVVLTSSCGKEEDIITVDAENTFTDPRDGKIYQTVTIGNQVWMAENFAYAPSSGNFWAYDNDDTNVEIYGYLYDWQTALDVCPDGWHLPSDEEWRELSSSLGGYQAAGDKLKATGTIEAGTGLWHAGDSEATNKSGFTALPGGFGSINGNFGSIGYNGFWWSTTEFVDGKIWTRYIWYKLSSLQPSRGSKTDAYSVRYVKD